MPAERLAGIVRESADEEQPDARDRQGGLRRPRLGRPLQGLRLRPGRVPGRGRSSPTRPTSRSPPPPLADMIGKTLFATAKAHSHYAISGVLWEAGGKKLQLVATDGHRLAQAKGALGKAAARDVTAIVPAKLMAPDPARGRRRRGDAGGQGRGEPDPRPHGPRGAGQLAGAGQLPQVRRRDPPGVHPQGHHQDRRRSSTASARRPC